MKGDKKHIWIEVAYKRFARLGDSGLSVEAIAKDLGKNKSSFYHYFGDINTLRSQILAFHVEKAKQLGLAIDTCEKLEPDVLNLIVSQKEDFFFHRQLRLEKNNETYKHYYEKAYDYVEKALLDKLTVALGLEGKQLFSSALLNLVSDNFLLRINEDTLSYSWLEAYLKELYTLANHIKNS